MAQRKRKKSEAQLIQTGKNTTAHQTYWQKTYKH